MIILKKLEKKKPNQKVKNLYNENLKTFKKKTEQDLSWFLNRKN